MACSASPTASLNLSIVGDLHLEPADLSQWEAARAQIKAALSDAAGAPLPDARVVQLGDLGAYAAKPGSRQCFAGASPKPEQLAQL